jgi:hypothetical protein
MIRLNDIWRNVNHEIGFYIKETFDDVPQVPGVYAWFYPLRITTRDPLEFIDQVNSIINYDCSSNGKPRKTTKFGLNWETITQHFEIDYQRITLDNFMDIWKKYSASDEMFDHLRSIIMKASIFMPPLYVGKTNNLYTRCKQHISGSNANDFHKRFEDYSKSLNLPADKVSKLLFVTIKAQNDKTGGNDDLESLIEAILKILVKPKYSNQ